MWLWATEGEPKLNCAPGQPIPHKPESWRKLTSFELTSMHLAAKKLAFVAMAACERLSPPDLYFYLMFYRQNGDGNAVYFIFWILVSSSSVSRRVKHSREDLECWSCDARWGREGEGEVTNAQTGEIETKNAWSEYWSWYKRKEIVWHGKKWSGKADLRLLIMTNLSHWSAVVWTDRPTFIRAPRQTLTNTRVLCLMFVRPKTLTSMQYYVLLQFRRSGLCQGDKRFTRFATDNHSKFSATILIMSRNLFWFSVYFFQESRLPVIPLSSRTRLQIFILSHQMDDRTQLGIAQIWLGCHWSEPSYK